MSHPFNLSGKRILVTGASSGIGKSIAIECSKMGAELVLLGRNEERLIETLLLLEKGLNHSYCIFDFSEGKDFGKIGNQVIEGGKLHGLVNCAGVTSTLPIKSITNDRLKKMFEVNVFGAFEVTKWFTKKSVVSESGASVIFIASIMGVVGEVGKTLYSMSKGALISGSKSMALELANRKIRVNTISPGVVLTPMVKNGIYAQEQESFEKVSNKHPLGIGEPNDIANAVIFLLSDGSKWITGSNILVDGGYTAGK